MKKVINYVGKEFPQTWEGLKFFLQHKLHYLNKEELEFREKNKEKLKQITDKIASQVTQDELKLLTESAAWSQQEGKMIFISSILEDFFNDYKSKENLFKERWWRYGQDENGNLILEKTQ